MKKAFAVLLLLLLCLGSIAHAKTMVYWSDSGDNVIRRKPVDGSGPAQVIVNPGTNLYTMAVDAVGGKVYWDQQDADGWSLWRANLDGSGSERFLAPSSFLGHHTDPTGPGVEGMAVDAVGGKLYWYNNGYAGRNICRVSLDGTNPEVFVSDAGDGRDLHVIGDQLYWVCNGIYRTPLAGNGSTSETVSYCGPLPTGLWCMGIPYYAENKLFWNGWPQGYQGVYISSLSDPWNTKVKIADDKAMDFAVDYQGGYVYWTRYDGVNAGGIGRARLDGSGVEVFESGDSLTQRSRYLDTAPDVVPETSSLLALTAGLGTLVAFRRHRAVRIWRSRVRSRGA